MISTIASFRWELAAIEYYKGDSMTENKLTKLKGRLLNIQTQLIGASMMLAKSEPEINAKIQDANKLVADAFKICDTIKTQEEQPTPKKKHKQKIYTPVIQREVIIQRNEPATYNRLCRNYSEIRNRKNEVIERTCVVGMDMCYCSKKCAYATNNVCSTKVY